MMLFLFFTYCIFLAYTLCRVRYKVAVFILFFTKNFVFLQY